MKIIDRKSWVQTTGKRLGQIVRFELETPGSPAATAPPANLGHITEEDEKSYRGSDAEVRQKARQALESLLEGNARFRKVSSCTIPCDLVIYACAKVCRWLQSPLTRHLTLCLRGWAGRTLKMQGRSGSTRGSTHPHKNDICSTVLLSQKTSKGNCPPSVLLVVDCIRPDALGM
jgi:hypothetical protein